MPVLCVLLLVVGASLPSQATASPRESIERATALIESGEFAFARTYLEPALIDPRIHSTERSRAYYLRGFSYEQQGLWVSARQDYNRALEFNADNPMALVALGRMQMSGTGGDHTPEIGVQLFTKSADLGLPRAQYLLGLALLNGEGTVQNVAQARRWLEQAANGGVLAAMLALGQSYRANYADEADPQQAADWYRRAAQQGEPEGLAAIAWMRKSGELPGLSEADLFNEFLAAADAGSHRAAAFVGHGYLVGQGVAADVVAAQRYYELAAEQVPEGHVGLGYIAEINGDVPAALGHYRAAVQLDEGRERLVELLLQQGDAAAQQEVVALLSDQPSVQAANTVAWLQATSVHSEVRNGHSAVALASQAVAAEPSPHHRDTLAAALAELGRFAEAIEQQREALAALPEDSGLRQEFERHLALLLAGRAIRDG